MTTKTHPQAPGGGPARTEPDQITGTYQQAIEGRFRRITTHEMAMAWWLHLAGHITRRQLRIYFAGHEMAERRRYTGPGERSKPLYGLQELKALVGGRGSSTADRDLSADVRRLGELGLVRIDPHAIAFASSIEQIALEGSLEDFWAFFRALPHPRRAVPVPRRTLRALAAGFRRSETAYILAALIRSVFWHRDPPGGGAGYRVDGRTKLSWIAGAFGISRRAATEARAHLIELGWLVPLETPQWQLNRWGVHDAVNVDWTPSAGLAPETADAVDNSGPDGASPSGGSATPPAQNSAGSASPCLNRSALPTGDTKTRRPGAPAPGPAGDCIPSHQKAGSRKRRERAARPGDKPNIRDLRTEDLKDPDALRELCTQAIGLGFAFAGDSGELDFFALAHRALTRGQRPGALFFDLISKHRTAFITIADEEVARGQLRELRDGPVADTRFGGGGEGLVGPPAPEFTEEERIVQACIQVAKQHRIEDPFRVARQVKGWTRDQWEEAYLRYRTAQMRRQASCHYDGIGVLEGFQ